MAAAIWHPLEKRRQSVKGVSHKWYSDKDPTTVEINKTSVTDALTMY